MSSALLDEGKAEIYAEAAIPEYWMVRPEDGAVDVARSPTTDGYQLRTTLTRNDILRCDSIAGIELAIADIQPKNT